MLESLIPKDFRFQRMYRLYIALADLSFQGNMLIK